MARATDAYVREGRDTRTPCQHRTARDVLTRPLIDQGVEENEALPC